MAPARSPPPSWSAISEPDPSSDEDLVPNDPAFYSLQRKRKNTGQKSFQPASKRPKTIEKSTVSSNRTANAVAGPSRRRSQSPSLPSGAGSNGRTRPPQTSSGSRVKTSRHSVPQPTAKTAEPPSTARTKVVRRTREEKQRQRSSLSSDDLPPVPRVKAPVNGTSFPSASAPAPRNRGFQREKIRQRYQAGGSSNTSRGAKSAPVKRIRKGNVAPDTEVIDLASSSEDNNSGEVIVVADSDSETEFMKKSAARKTHKQKGIKPAPPDDQDVVEIIDSDDEPARPVVRPEMTGKKEDNGIDLLANRPNDISTHSPLQNPVENGMNLGLDEGMDFGAEDLTLPNRSPEPSLAPSEMPFDSMLGIQSSVIGTSPVKKDASPEIAKTTFAAVVDAPEAAIQSSNVPNDSPDVPLLPLSTTILEGGPEDKELPPDDLIAEDPVRSFTPALQDECSITDEVAGSHVEQDGAPLDDRARLSPQELTAAKSRAFQPSHHEESSVPHPRPNVLLEFHANDSFDFPETLATLPDPIRPQALTSSTAQSVPESEPPNPQPRRKSALPPREAKDDPVASGKSSHPPSPYKGIRDRALGKSAATLQQDLGLPVKGKAKGKEPLHPKLDLRSFLASTVRQPLLKKRMSSRTTPPPFLDGADPAPATKPRPEQSTTSLERLSMSAPSKTQSATPNTHLWKQRSLVDAIITTGQHNTQSTSALSHSSLPRRTPLPPLPSMNQQTPLSPPHRPNTPLTSALSNLSLPPCTGLLPAVDQQTSPAPPPLQVKLEAPSGLSAALIHDIIDLTLSDEEADTPKVGVQATQSPGQPPKPSMRPRPRIDGQSTEEGRQRLVDRMSRLLRSLPDTGRSVSSGAAVIPSSNSQTPASSTSAVTEGGMEVAGNGALSQTGMDRPTATRDLRRSRTPPGDVAAEMEIDNRSEIPPSSEQQFVPEALDAPPVLVESALAGSPEREMVVRETVTGSLQQLAEGLVDSAAQDTGPHQPAAAPDERRSYDDVEVYYLEYIGPPTTYGPTISDLEEAAVEASITDDLPAQEDMAAISELATDDDPSSSVTPSERDFLEASDDEGSAIPLRRSSRISSHSSSSDPLDLLGREFEDDFDSPPSPISPNSNIPVHSLPLSPVSPNDSNIAALSSVEYPVMTWDTYKQDLSNFQPHVYYAKNLVSLLHDYINAQDDSFRMSPHMRQVFESAIVENTADDEPDAPLIRVENEVDDEPAPPWEFYYTNKLWLGEGIDPPDMTKLVGCDCKGKCDPKSKTCSCLRRQKEYLKGYYDDGFAYDNKGRLRTVGVPIFECNSLCGCDDDECKNRVVQHGRKCHVTIKKTVDKGWGVFASKRILRGTFIGLYSGEFMRDDICERRGLVYDKSGRTYLMNIDFYYLNELVKDDDDDNEYTVDAYHAGNFTRFLNNSCDPNCKVNPCYIDEPDIKKPLLTLFALRDIAAGDELCFSYKGYDPNNPDEDGDSDKGDGEGGENHLRIKNKCYCKSTKCRGSLF